MDYPVGQQEGVTDTTYEMVPASYMPMPINGVGAGPDGLGGCGCTGISSVNGFGAQMSTGPNPTVVAVGGLVATASAAASAYHGYKRNNSVGWAVVWGLLGGLFPVITPVIAVAQGYAKPAKKK